ncbi:MAG: hypothetical protein JKX97_02095 [Candidatus Lindowbacteria bacterium]|nr:hypothetical protein [Candidatus Lindowbacteria bacterium]
MDKKVIPIIFAAFIFGFVGGYIAKPATITAPVSDAAEEDEHNHEAENAQAQIASGPGSVTVTTALTDEEIEGLRQRWLKNNDDLDALLGLLEGAPAGTGGEGMMSALSMARQLSKDSSSAMIRLVGISSKFGAHPLALMAAQRAIKLDPDNPESYRLAGRICMFDLQNYERAIHFYEHYLKLAPNGSAAPMVQEALKMMKSGAISSENPLGRPPA